MASRTWIAAALVLAFSGSVDAHIAMRSPAPRDSGLKAGPCGTAGSQRGATTTTFAPGETITVEWDETVGHPGHYRIAFDDDGNDVFVDPNLPTDNFAFTLVDQIADKDGMQHYTQAVTLPDIECTNCTLQLMQIMTTAVPYNSFYYQCADLTLSGTAGTGGSDSSGGCSTGSPGLGIALALGGLMVRRRKHR